MHYYKGLYFGSLYNLGFMGGWRCGEISIDGHYNFVTDLKHFVVWKFGTYYNFNSIIPDVQIPELSPVEALYVNDHILSQMRRDMSNDQHPNLTDVSRELWADIYGDTRDKAVEMWANLTKHPFSKSNVSANIVQGDDVKNTKTGEEFHVDYYCDTMSLNKHDHYVLTKRYDYFPSLPLHENIRTKFDELGLTPMIKNAYWDYNDKKWQFCVHVKNAKKFGNKLKELGVVELIIKSFPEIHLLAPAAYSIAV